MKNFKVLRKLFSYFSFTASRSSGEFASDSDDDQNTTDSPSRSVFRMLRTSCSEEIEGITKITQLFFAVSGLQHEQVCEGEVKRGKSH